MKTKILYVVNDAAFFLSHRLPLAVGARKAGYDVHVATPEDRHSPRIHEEGLTYHAIRMHRSKTGVLAEAATFASLYRLYRRVRPDIVHNVTIKPVVYGGIAARFAGVPCVVSAVSGLGYLFISSGFKAKAIRKIIRRMYRFAFSSPNSRVIVQNPDDLQTLVDEGILRKDKAVMIRGSGVDLTAFTPHPELEGKVTVSLPSRMLWDKGVGEFVEAARTLKKEGVHARFVLVGDVDPSNPASVEQHQIKSWVHDGAVEWWGYRQDMAEVFRQSHVVCLPSYREGLPKVLLEAAACGRPIVATDVPGCREIAVHDDNAYLVPPRDGASLAEALKRLIENPAMRKTMGEKGRCLSEKEFALEKVVAATLEVYKELIKSMPEHRHA